jgi:hypothetical protein
VRFYNNIGVIAVPVSMDWPETGINWQDSIPEESESLEIELQDWLSANGSEIEEPSSFNELNRFAIG